MGVTTYQPAATATLYKRVPRRQGLASRFRDAKRTIDLTPLIGQGCNITTTHGVRLAGGKFSITLQDSVDARTGGVMDSLYGLLEPMDYIEIRMARQSELYVGGNLPIVMRGFISDVEHSQAMGPDGKPQRRVRITGEDYGKIPQIIVILTYEDFTSGLSWLTSFPLFFEYGFNPANETSAGFMAKCVNGIINPYLRAMRGFVGAEDAGAIPLLGYDNGGTGGVVAPYGAPAMNGTIQQFMLQWADCPWNELFIEDRESGPVLVYRPSPFEDASGRRIFGGKLPVHDFVLQSDDILVMNVRRSDSDVANYFWVEAPRSILPLGGLFNTVSIAQGDLTMRGYVNNEPDLYGVRLMSAQTNQSGAIGTTQAVEDAQREQQARSVPKLNRAAGFADIPNKERGVLDAEAFAWVKGRRDQLKAMNKDNAIFESGSLVVKGDERFKAGRYLTVASGNLRARFYVTQVTQSYTPFGAFISTLQVERGDGFIKRTQLQESPALNESGKGVY